MSGPRQVPAPADVSVLLSSDASVSNGFSQTTYGTGRAGVLETQTHSQMGLLPKQLWSSQATQGSKDWRAQWNLCEQAGEELSTGRSGANCL